MGSIVRVQLVVGVGGRSALSVEILVQSLWRVIHRPRNSRGRSSSGFGGIRGVSFWSKLLDFLTGRRDNPLGYVSIAR